MAEKHLALSEKIALTPSTADAIRRVLNSRLCGQILRFPTIQRFQYNQLISALFSISTGMSQFGGKRKEGRKVLCTNSCYLVKDSNKTICTFERERTKWDPGSIDTLFGLLFFIP